MMPEEDVPELRIPRVEDIALLDHPADATGLRSINVYRDGGQDFVAINGKKFKLDPQRLLYSLQGCTRARRPIFICSWYESRANGSIPSPPRRSAR